MMTVERCPFHPLHQEPCPLCEVQGIPIFVDSVLPPNTIAIVSRNEKDEVIDRKFIVNVGGSDADRS